MVFGAVSWSLAGCFALFGLDGYGPPADEPDDAGSSPVDAPAVEDVTHDGKVVFVTSVPFAGEIGSVAAADWRCQMLAMDAGLTGTFRAWLSDPESSPATRFTKPDDDDDDDVDAGEEALVTPDRRRIIAPGISALTSGLVSPIDMTERGTTLPEGTFTFRTEADGRRTCVVSGTMVWTNTDPAGLRASSSDCSAWSTSASSVTGYVGVIPPAEAAPSDTWTAACAQPCSAEAHLYCFEQ